MLAAVGQADTFPVVSDSRGADSVSGEGAWGRMGCSSYQDLVNNPSGWDAGLGFRAFPAIKSASEAAGWFPCAGDYQPPLSCQLLTHWVCLGLTPLLCVLLSQEAFPYPVFLSSLCIYPCSPGVS